MRFTGMSVQITCNITTVETFIITSVYRTTPDRIIIPQSSSTVIHLIKSSRRIVNIKFNRYKLVSPLHVFILHGLGSLLSDYYVY